MHKFRIQTRNSNSDSFVLDYQTQQGPGASLLHRDHNSIIYTGGNKY